MRVTYKKHIVSLFLVIAVMAFPILAAAQIQGTPSEPEAPIDGGLSLLVAAGVGYGARKLKEKRKQTIEK